MYGPSTARCNQIWSFSSVTSCLVNVEHFHGVLVTQFVTKRSSCTEEPSVLYPGAEQFPEALPVYFSVISRSALIGRTLRLFTKNQNLSNGTIQFSKSKYQDSPAVWNLFLLSQVDARPMKPLLLSILTPLSQRPKILQEFFKFTPILHHQPGLFNQEQSSLSFHGRSALIFHRRSLWSSTRSLLRSSTKPLCLELF